jgi:GTP:adenosylcobinamide-phosphate guanylyltransferase
MEAIITAGGKPTPKEKLYALTRGEYKCMLDVAGKPMIQWVLDAVNATQVVDRIIITGLPKEIPVKSRLPITFLPDSGGLMSNAYAGAQEIMRTNPTCHHALYLCSDIPAVTAEMLTWMAEKIQETNDDLYYPAIEREVMEKRYPNSRRTYIKLKDVEVCGGDVFGIRPAAAQADNPLWSGIVESRKNPLKQASMVGFDTLLALLRRKYTLDEAVDKVCARLGFRGRVLRSPYAEMGMDVDKPHQWYAVHLDLGGKPTA